MIDLKVIEYIKSETAKGVSKDKITEILMQGGGWTMVDIRAHFLFIEQNPGEITAEFIQNTRINEIKDTPIQPKKGVNIFGANFLIFLVYYIIALVSIDSGGEMLLGAYIAHAGLLILISIGEFLRGISKKVKTRAWQYFLAAILLLIVGFGACTIAFTKIAL